MTGDGRAVAAAAAFDPSVELGPRLRRVRADRGLSVRELARRTSCSPSLISQIERGLSAPSVGMLYAIASELRTSLDFLFGVAVPGDSMTATAHGDGHVRPEQDGSGLRGSGEDPARPGQAGEDPAWPARAGEDPAGFAEEPAAGGAGTGAGAAGRPRGGPDPAAAGHGLVQRAGHRRTIDLASGVRWERLTPGADDRVDFLEVIYEPSGHSTDSRRLLRHDGQEYGLIISGRLHASVGFETYLLGPGDSIAFDSSLPHQYWNATTADVHAIWVVVHAQPGRA
jgi:transcriptional regulator with XRE-family HTH domain/mannose-6-phosphate isomerase-like protein (cupin superfamily)